MRGTARPTSSTTIGLLPGFKQMRMSVLSVQVGSLSAKPALTAFVPRRGRLGVFCPSAAGSTFPVRTLQKTQLVFPLVASGKSRGER